jgi:hypothetical protein
MVYNLIQTVRSRTTEEIFVAPAVLAPAGE